MSKRSPSRTMESFEMESGTNASNETDYSRPQSASTGQVDDGFGSAFGRLPKRREHTIFEQQPGISKAKKFAILRYVGLSTLATIASFICPGNTIVWKDSKSFQYYRLKIAVIYIIVMISFFTLQDSDPGYLTRAILEQSIEGAESLLSKDSEDDANDDVGRETQDGVKGDNALDEKTDLESGVEEGQSTLHATALQPELDTTGDPLAAPSNKKSSLEEEFGALGSSASPLALKHRKACVLCAIPKPPLRSHHCKICSKCVATFDHHCGFLAKCIGERNHFRFWVFVILNMISIRMFCEIVNSSSYGMTTMLFKSEGKDDDNKLILLSFMVVLIKIYFYLVWLVAHLLFVIHSYLILTNKTTFELNIGNKLDYMKDTKPADCIFSKGCWENIRIRCFLDTMCISSFVKTSRCCGSCHGGNYQLLRRSKEDSEGSSVLWNPMIWTREDTIIRDSEDWWNHPWQNKYWQCC